MHPLAQVLSWSFPCGRFAGIQIRVSWLLLLWMGVDLLRAAQAHSVALMIAALVIPPTAMLMHALAHVAAARALGGSAFSTTISILVDTTDLTLPLRPWPHALTGLAGPAANLLILTLCWGLMNTVAMPPTLQAVVGYTMFVHGVIGMVNLLACPPFDGHRWWRGVLWACMRMSTAVQVASILGLISAVLLIAFGAWRTDPILIVFGVVSLLASIQDRQEIASGNDPVFHIDPSRVGKGPPSRFTLARRERAEARQAQTEADEQAVLDRLLAKVSAEGLPSLTAAERKHLQRISQAQKERMDG